MSVRGFLDDSGRKVPFAAIAKTYDQCDWSEPLPALVNWARQKTRDHDFLRARAQAGLPPIKLTSSPTGSLQPVRMAALDRIHHCYVDPGTTLASGLGTLFHQLAENSTDAMLDRKLVKPGSWISEQDLMFELNPGEFMPMSQDLKHFLQHDLCDIWDYKFLSPFMYEKMCNPFNWGLDLPAEDYYLQQNMYRIATERGCHAMEKDADGNYTGRLVPVAPVKVRKTWLMAYAKYLSPDLRQKGLKPKTRIEVPRHHDDEEILDIYREKWDMHFHGIQLANEVKQGRMTPEVMQGSLPLCSPKEQWRSEGAWKAYKNAESSRALPNGVFSEKDHGSKEEALRLAKEWIAERKDADSVDLRYVAGNPLRCASYCNLAGICEQLRAEEPDLWREKHLEWRDSCHTSKEDVEWQNELIDDAQTEVAI